MRLFGDRSDGETDEEDEQSDDYSDESNEPNQEDDTSETSSSDSDENTLFIPSSLRAFQDVYGDNVVVKKNTYKFKKGFDPFAQQQLDFIVASNTSCPYNIPMLQSDACISEAALLAAIQDPERPISEYAKKEFFFKCAQAFQSSIKADKTLIADEIRKHFKRYDHLFGTNY